MSVKEMSKEELELLSYKDITVMYIREEGPSKTADIFKFITKKLGLPKSYFENKIGDYYTMLSTDKRFVLVEAEWDLREKHSSETIKTKKHLEEDDFDEDYEEDLELLDEKEEMESEPEEDFDAKTNDDDDYDDPEEDLKNLVIIDEDELELE